MAKSKRGGTMPSSETPDSGGQVEDFSLVLPSSDDEAPEEVTFEDAKTEVLRSMRHALDRARREKEQLKEKRRKRHELFQEQKKRKLLPADVLEEIDSAPSESQKQPEDEAEEEQQEEKKSGKKAHSKSLKGNYTVTTARERTSASCQQQAAEDFVQSRLYGPGSCRTTNNEMLSLQNKTGRKKSAAVQFVKKDWASKEKAKAEKLKQRWIHTKQIPLC